jgi:hypothetical protein
MVTEETKRIGFFKVPSVPTLFYGIENWILTATDESKTHPLK